MREVVLGDTESWLTSVDGRGATFWMDPPDNIGLNYNSYLDNRPDYIAWIERIVRGVFRARFLRCWISYYHRWDMDMMCLVSRLGVPWRKVIWRFTFGQYSEKMANGFRPILLLGDTALHWDRARVDSMRMLLGDPRAAGARVVDDVWEFPRVVGNSRERRSWHPTQHPLALMERVIKLSCQPGDWFVDGFCGSGTSLLCNVHDVRRTGVEIDPYYYSQIASLLR